MNLAPRLSQSLSIARERRRGVWWLLAGLITGAGLIVRTYQLGAAGLWFDEAFSYDAAVADPSTILHASADTGYPPLYYLFLHSWMSLFGTNEAILRVPSLLAGTL